MHLSYDYHISGLTWTNDPYPAWTYTKPGDVVSPSASFMFSDAISWQTNAPNSMVYTTEFVVSNPNLRNAYRHNGNINLLYYDGHAQTMARNQVDRNYFPTGQRFSFNKLWYPKDNGLP